MTTYGYARVSTSGQKTDMQVEALKKEGCDVIFEDVASGAKASRPSLDDMLAVLAPGDTVVVWKLDRLGRSTVHLFGLLEQLKERDVGVRSVIEGVDTSGSLGRFLFTILAGVAELERENIRTRVQAGIEKARRDGVKFGRKRKMGTHQRRLMLRLHQQGDTYEKIARDMGCSKATAWEIIQSEKAKAKAGVHEDAQMDIEDY